ncbi:MAG TPA: hypothetical protein VJZ32_10635 [Candidatus Bathyarchaeia archaeon]|nr:hypothetical protein [Candidatus Bathyarchaeia archaeon]HKM78597.1 hypothetical protein [Candidatus Bathyarchaeia archaeon]
MRKPDLIKPIYRISLNPAERLCHHNEIRNIIETFDKERKRIRFERCEQCGLLMRKYSPA